MVELKKVINILFCSFFKPLPFVLFVFISFINTSLKADFNKLAVLQGLNKVTARVSTINAPIGRVVRFGKLDIIARTCDKRPPEETPESAVFLDIWEVKEGESAKSLFRGWMFASSPALSPMEHPVYDIWVLDCVNKDSITTSIFLEN